MSETDYYPRAKLRIVVRLEEFGDASRLAPAPKATTKNLDGVAPNRSPLVPQPDPDAPPGVNRYVLLPAGAEPSKASPQDRLRSDDGLTFDVEVAPHDLTWSQNGVRTADTLSGTIRYIDCPIDARLTRMIAVEAYVGCVSEEVLADEALGKPPDFFVLPPGYTDASGAQRTNLRFQGFVDKWEVEWGLNKEPLIRFEACDNTRLLIEQECPPRLVVGAEKPIHQAVADYLANFVQFAGLTVEYRPGTDDPPTLKEVLSGTAFRPHLGPPPAKGGGAGGQKLSVLDYLTDVTRAIGHSMRVDGTAVIIQRVRSLMTNSVSQRPDDPWRPRTVGGQTATYRQLIYGRNVEDLRVARNFTKQVPTNVEVRSYLTEKKKDLVVRFPLPADRQVYALPGNTQPDQKWSVHEVSGISDEKTLRAVAQGIYEELGRHEVEIWVKTHNLGSFGGDNLDPDILDMKVGDTFELLVNRTDDEASSMTAIEKALTAQEQAAALMRLAGFSDEFAAAYGKAYTDAGFLTQFRLKTLKLDWSVDSGISLEIGGINYIQVRADKLLPAGEEPGNTTRTPGEGGGGTQ